MPRDTIFAIFHSHSRIKFLLLHIFIRSIIKRITFRSYDITMNVNVLEI